MKIESFQCIGRFGEFQPMSIPLDFDYHSIHECAILVRDSLIVPYNHIESVLVWLDNQRNLFVTKDSYLVSYFQHFNN